MKTLNLIKAYVSGNRLDRIAIQSKVIQKVCKRSIKKMESNFKFTHLIDVSNLFCINTINTDVFEHYLRHEYNFFGLGWKNWSAEQIENENGYKNILWNKDIRSGYVFSEPNMDSKLIGRIPQGTDIKIPWELGRMQHWPQIALYGVRHIKDRSKIQNEFQSQMIDFMDCNPIGIGVHYYCAMEVAIRAINLMIAYDILDQYPSCELSKNFKIRFEEYLYSHFYVIIHRLEKNYFTHHTGNHYLADLCGLLWFEIYFESKQIASIRNAVVDEFVKEFKKQFTETGSNYECSTGYHMLASEISALSFFAISKLQPTALGENEWSLLFKIRSIIDIFEARDNKIVQVGDNDSGRILKLNPLFIGSKENCIDPKEVKNLLDYLLFHSTDSQYGRILESYHISIADMRATRITQECNDNDSIGIRNFCKKEKCENVKFKNIHKVDVNLGEVKKIDLISDFGLIKIKCENADVYIRTVPKYERMDTSHVHDDVFSYQIIGSNFRINEDIGSIVYTSDRKKRNYFAGALGHNVPIHSKTIVKRIDTFVTETRAIGTVEIKDKNILVIAKWDNIVHLREFELSVGGMVVTDYSNEEFVLNEPENNYYSLGYGQLYNKR